MSTIADVARLAGVSKATASRVLSGKNAALVAPATAERVRRAAQELGYQPHPVAAALATGRTGAIALWMRNVHRPFFSELMHYVADQTQRHGLDLIIVEQRHTRPESEGFLSAGSQWPVDGILAHEPPGVVQGRPVGAWPSVPVVVMSEMPFTGTDAVHFDLRDGASRLYEHLVQQGCRSLAYMAPDEVANSARGRYAAYCDVTGRHRLKRTFIAIPEAAESCQAGYRAAYDFYAHGGRADALCCHNDELAIGALRALRDLGLRVPEDVAVSGCDDVTMAAYVEPPLTTIRIPIREMVENAFAMLMDRINDPTIPHRNLTLPTQPVVRASTVRRKDTLHEEDPS